MSSTNPRPVLDLTDLVDARAQSDVEDESDGRFLDPPPMYQEIDPQLVRDVTALTITRDPPNVGRASPARHVDIPPEYQDNHASTLNDTVLPGTSPPSELENECTTDLADRLSEEESRQGLSNFDLNPYFTNFVGAEELTSSISPSKSDEDISPGTTPRRPVQFDTSLDGVHERLGIPKSTLVSPSLSGSSKSSTITPYSLGPAALVGPSSATRARNSSFGSIVEEEWDAESLLELTDVVRAALKAEGLPVRAVDTLNELLQQLLEDEQSPIGGMGLAIISHTRFDKMLGALLEDKPGIQELNPRFQEVLKRARSLRRVWQQRFLTRYFDLDEVRLKEMRANRLHDMSLIAGDKEGQRWNVKKRNPIDEMEGGLSFEPGAWWVNLCSAYRDGIVGNATENVTNGHYGVTALPMVTGTEEEGPRGTVKLIKEGGKKDIYLNLIKQVGRNIRVLRGHTLWSKYAPLAGIRYDGLYTIKQYGHKLSTERETYRLELTLERVPGQKPVDELLLNPTPAELDDWQYYNRVLGEDILGRKGNVAYSEWKKKEEAEEREREEWQRWHDFKRQHSQVSWVKPKPASRTE